MVLRRQDGTHSSVEVPPGAAAALVHRWQPGTVREGATATVPDGWRLVAADEARVLATLDAGLHRLDADEQLFIGLLPHSGAGTLDAALYLVDTAPRPGRSFSGRIDDPTGGRTPGVAGCGAHVEGTATVQVNDPAALVAALGARVDLGNAAAFDYWITKQLLRATRRATAWLLRHHPERAPDLLDDAGALIDDVEDESRERLRGTGLSIVCVHDLDLRFDDPGSLHPRGAATRARAATGAAGGPCATCGTPAPFGARYCPACGAAVGDERCARCAAPLLPVARYCVACGTPAPGDDTALR